MIRTRRLRLIPATIPHLLAELSSRDGFAELLDATVPDSWPPGQYDRDAQQFFLQSLQQGGAEAVGWYGWYAIMVSGSPGAATLVGSGGYLGPPAQNGTVEIGYSICDEWRGQGFGTEMAKALAEYAQQLPNVQRVIAHTDPRNAASIAVLRRSGFRQVLPSDDPDALLFEWILMNDRTNDILSDAS